MVENFSKGRRPAKPGAALKALRSQLGLTLAEASQRTGLSISVLSKVERDKLALTFDKLVRLSEGLQIDISQLFGASEREATRADGATRRCITRAGEGRSIEMPRGNYLYLATELLNKRFVPILGEVSARDIKEYGEFMRHQGEEFVFVVQGTLDLYTDIYTPARLETGDSVYFDSGMGHAYIAVGDEPCRILSICATAERELMQAHQLIASSAKTSATYAPSRTPPREPLRKSPISKRARAKV